MLLSRQQFALTVPAVTFTYEQTLHRNLGQDLWACRHLIQSTLTLYQNLDVICLQQNDDNKHGLLSWVPDWECRNLYPRHCVVGLHIRESSFKATGSSAATVSFSPNGEVLTAAGFVIDTISTAAVPLYIHGPDSDFIPTLKVFWGWWEVFVKARGSSPAECEVFPKNFSWWCLGSVVFGI